MELNMKHVVIFNAIFIPVTVFGWVLNQPTLLDIGFLGLFAQTLPLVLALVDRIFRDEPEPVYDNRGNIVKQKVGSVE